MSSDSFYVTELVSNLHCCRYYVTLNLDIASSSRCLVIFGNSKWYTYYRDTKANLVTIWTYLTCIIYMSMLWMKLLNICNTGYPSFPVFVHFSIFLYMMNTFFRDSINAVDSLQKLLIFKNIWRLFKFSYSDRLVDVLYISLWLILVTQVRFMPVTQWFMIIKQAN